MIPNEPLYIALGGTVHAASQAESICGTTLCGKLVAGDKHALPVVPQRIGCERCIVLLELAEQIPRKFYRQRKRRVSKQ